MTPIKIILAILLLLVLRAFLVRPSLMLVKRLTAIIVFLLLLLLVIFPNVSTKIANLIGVGRGVDLIFYISSVFFLFLIIALWRRNNTLMEKITKLSREIALQHPYKTLVDNDTLPEEKHTDTINQQ